MRDNYRPGDNYLIDDKTGLKIRASEARQQWNKIVTHGKNFDTRHPQDFVKARADRQNVPNARPRQPDAFRGPLTTALAVAAIAGDQSITVESTARMEAGDHLVIMLDSGDPFRVIIQTITDATTLVLTANMPGPAAVGKVIFDNTAMAAADIG
jgi:hypothetical protein